jgi:hypothetical protein
MQTKTLARAGQLSPLYNTSIVDVLFGTKYELLPQVSLRYELDLAYGETQSLTDDDPLVFNG